MPRKRTPAPDPRQINLVGRQFGYWSVVDIGPRPKPTSRVHWLCRCLCGAEKSVQAQSLMRGNSRSCGCKPMPKRGSKIRAIELAGQRFGRWVVVDRADDIKGKPAWNCSCDCGRGGVVVARNLIREDGIGSRSCGCAARDASSGRMTRLNAKHRMCGTREYATWSAMVGRCHRPASPNYLRYGAAGITVCERWRGSFANFHEDMGPRPEGCSLDRIDNGGNYEPGNCRWATPKQQSRNRAVSRLLDFDGRILPLTEWSEITGVPAQSIRQRIRSGWSIEAALTTPIGKHNRWTRHLVIVGKSYE